MRRIRVVVVALTVTVLATGCGNSGGSKSSGPSGSSSRAATATVLAAGLLGSTDLPAWSHQPPKDNSDSIAEVKKVAQGIPACDNFVSKIVDGDQKRRSDKFEQADANVRDNIEVYPSAGVVAGQLDLYLDPTTIDCYRELFRKTLTNQGFTVNSIDVSPIAVDHLGDGEYGYRLTTSVTGGGAHYPTSHRPNRGADWQVHNFARGLRVQCGPARTTRDHAPAQDRRPHEASRRIRNQA